MREEDEQGQSVYKNPIMKGFCDNFNVTNLNRKQFLFSEVEEHERTEHRLFG